MRLVSVANASRPFIARSGRIRDWGGSPQIVVLRRDVAQFDGRVERQKQLIEELERDKHVDMLGDTHNWTTLVPSLRLARDHLQLEIDHHGKQAQS